MPPNAFQQRLTRLMEQGNLRTADVARWFSRRHSTVRGWAVDGREPAGTATDVRLLFARLNDLEKLIRTYRRRTSDDLRQAIRTIRPAI